MLNNLICILYERLINVHCRVSRNYNRIIEVNRVRRYDNNKHIHYTVHIHYPRHSSAPNGNIRFPSSAELHPRQCTVFSSKIRDEPCTSTISTIMSIWVYLLKKCTLKHTVFDTHNYTIPYHTVPYCIPYNNYIIAYHTIPKHTIPYTVP